jgi:hypothetical protein
MGVGDGWENAFESLQVIEQLLEDRLGGIGTCLIRKSSRLAKKAQHPNRDGHRVRAGGKETIHGKVEEVEVAEVEVAEENLGADPSRLVVSGRDRATGKGAAQVGPPLSIQGL